MFNDPEWASKEEWDAYAWFGFAISEAQGIERQLLVIAVALSLAENGEDPGQDAWFDLYDELGHLTLGRLISNIRKHAVVTEDLLRTLDEARIRRNALAHEFFWPHRALDKERLTPEIATEELRRAASLFSNLSTQLEYVMSSVMDRINVRRTDAEEKAAQVVGSSRLRDYPS